LVTFDANERNGEEIGGSKRGGELKKVRESRGSKTDPWQWGERETMMGTREVKLDYS